jgi:phospholipid/cholesterol/gamma-HCH transport system substrate-binding protein
MKKPSEMELKVGIFVSVGLALIMTAILMLGGANSIFTRHNKYTVHFPSVEGLMIGAKVLLGGINVGTVSTIEFDPALKSIKVTTEVKKSFEEWIKHDSTAEILTQGVLGDKYISIAPGSAESQPLKSWDEITTKPTKGLAEFLSKSDQLMVSLNSIAQNIDQILKTFHAKNRSEMFFDGMANTAKNLSEVSKKLNGELDSIQLKSAVKNLNSILEKINNGTGTVGALVNDPQLYYDAKALVGGANRNRIVRNLVRKTIKEEEKK